MSLLSSLTYGKRQIHILGFAEELYQRAEKIFKDKKGINFGEILICPACEWESFSIYDDENICYVCGYYPR